MKRTPAQVVALISTGAVFICSGNATAQTAKTLPRFEVVSIKSGDSRAPVSVKVSGLNWTAENIYVLDLVEFAFHMLPWQIVSSPRWLLDDRFTIDAKRPYGSNVGVNRFHDEELRLMVRALLEDRFGMAAHTESKQGSVYALTVSKTGVRMAEANREDASDPNEWHGAGAGPDHGNHVLFGKHASMSDIAFELATLLEKPVLDETELGGQYDFSVPFSQNPLDEEPPVSAAIRQIGLALQRRSGPVEVLVIDRIQKPSSN